MAFACSSVEVGHTSRCAVQVQGAAHDVVELCGDGFTFVGAECGVVDGEEWLCVDKKWLYDQDVGESMFVARDEVVAGDAVTWAKAGAKAFGGSTEEARVVERLAEAAALVAFEFHNSAAIVGAVYFGFVAACDALHLMIGVDRCED